MKHYGKQEFPQEAIIQLANIFNGIFSNKLNLPLHRDVTSVDFGDIFVEANGVKFVNFEKYIVELLTLYNNDLIKSFLTSEVFFDDFLNFERDRDNSESFFEDINLDTNLIQFNCTDRKLDSTIYDSTLYIGDIAIEIYNFNNSTELLNVQNLLNMFQESNLSVRFSFFDDNIHLYDKMIFIDAVNYDSTNQSILVYTDSTIIDSTDTSNINKVIINVCDVELLDTHIYVNLPYHKHKVEELSNLDDWTNKPNGYLKLINNNELNLPFNQWLWLVQSKIKDSLFIKEQIDELKKSNCFTAEYNTTTNTNVNYSEEEVIMQDQTVIEYTYIDMTIDINDLVDFRLINNNQKIKNEYINSIYDTTNYDTKYLCEFLYFDMDKVVNPAVTNVNDILDLTYVWIDKTDVDNNVIKVYDIDLNNNKIKIFNGYFDVDVLQASPTTIPAVILKYFNLCKDYYGKVFITKPISHKNISKKRTVCLDKDSDVLFKYDNESSSMTIDIYKFNIITSTYTYIGVISNNDSISSKMFSLDRGLYEFRPSNNTDIYNMYIFERV